MLEEVVDGRIALILPAPVLDELERVLADKLGFEDERLGSARELLERLATARPDRPEEVRAVTGGAHDDVVLACAIESSADVLVTGDRKHLLPLGEYRGVRVVTPQALLAELRAAED